MVLKMFVDSSDNNLKNMYTESASVHNDKLETQTQHIDAGFDLFAPRRDNSDNEEMFIPFFNVTREDGFTPSNKLDLKVCCSAQMFTDTGKSYNTGYYMYPRSSLSKTHLRLANSVGIIDSGYRGHLIGMLDVINTENQCYYGKAYERYLQVCAPSLVPIIVEIVETKDALGNETERGDNGFGSTGR
jgi:hypothetical protein